MKSKKILSILLSLSMILSLTAISGITVYAEEISGNISSDITLNDGDILGSITTSGDLTINVTGTVTMKYSVTIGEGHVTVTGGGTIERYNLLGRFFDVEAGGTLTLDGVTLDGNNIPTKNCAVYVYSGGEVIMNDGSSIINNTKDESEGKGGAVELYGKFTMNGGKISGCKARNYGGAVYMRDGSEFIMNDGIIENNKTTLSYAEYGGGAFYVRKAQLTVNGGTIQNNSSNSGGAIYNSSFGKTSIKGGKIINNTAAGDDAHGGAIFHSCREGALSVLQIGGDANIDKGNDIYLMNDSSVDKYIEITSEIKNPAVLTIENTIEGRVIASAADGVTLTHNDMARLVLSNSDYSLKLENNKIVLTQTTGGEEVKYPVYLGYDANGGEKAPDGESAEIPADTEAVFTVTSFIPTRPGYEFLGWSADKDATDAQYKSGDEIKTTRNLTLYAVWKEITTPQEENEFTVALSIIGWIYGDTPNAPTAEAKYGTPVFTYSNEKDGSYGSTVPSDAGIYYVKATVAETSAYKGLVSEPAEFEILPKTVNKKIPLAAPVKNEVPQTSIETDEYTATVDWTPEVSGKFAYDTVYTATVAIMPKANYTVKGIPENGFEFEGAASVTHSADSETVNVVYPATGSASSGGGGGIAHYSVSFNTNGGSKVQTQTVTRNSSVKQPADPTKENCTFAGWYTDKELKNKYDFSEKVIRSFTLFAAWTDDINDDKTDDNTKDDNTSDDNTKSNSLILTVGEKDADVFGTVKTNDVAPKIVNERTMLPARFVAENLGAKVDWDEENRIVTVTGKNEKDEDVTILITIGAQYAKINGEDVKLDAPAFIENDRTYTPIRFISEHLGATVEWNESQQKIIITKTVK